MARRLYDVGCRMIVLFEGSFSVPFMPPWRRPVTGEIRQRLMAWCAELEPGVLVDIDEWVGADPRHPLHVVVFSFPRIDRRPVLLSLKVADVERSDLVQGFQL